MQTSPLLCGLGQWHPHPRLESPQEVAEADSLLTQLEDKRGFRPGTLQIVAVLDTAKGNYDAVEIARANRRIWGLTWGVRIS